LTLGGTFRSSSTAYEVEASTLSSPSRVSLAHAAVDLSFLDVRQSRRVNISRQRGASFRVSDHQNLEWQSNRQGSLIPPIDDVHKKIELSPAGFYMTYPANVDHPLSPLAPPT